MKPPENSPHGSPEWIEWERWFESLDGGWQSMVLTGHGVQTVEALVAKVAVPAVAGTVGSMRMLEGDQQSQAERLVSNIVKIRLDEHDRRVDALERTLAGKSGGYGGLRDAYRDVTGEVNLPPGGFVHAMLGRAGGFDSRDSVDYRLSESINSSTWTSVLGDSVTRRIIAEYRAAAGLNAWRSLVSMQVYNSDFRVRRADAIGGYGLLPTVNQGAPFQPLPTPSNEEQTYSIAKRGGTEDLTMEAWTNDDVGAVRRIITSLGKAAANSINRIVLDALITNANTRDGQALFVAGHNNTTAVALASAALNTSRVAMRKQTRQSDANDVLGLVPRFIVVPPELELTALNLLPSYNAASRSTRDDLAVPLDLIVANHFSATTTTGWWLVADPAGCPTFELAFSGPDDNPTVALQGPDTNGGSDFTADKISIRIRHVYGATVADWRGFQRGNS